jgi:hypothetical protein
MKKKNVVMIPSVVRNPVISNYLTEDQRLEQVLMTIKSVKEKIPNSHAVILEGGTENKEDIEKMYAAGVDEVFSFDLAKNGKRLDDPNRSKSYGEMTLFLEYLNSNSFNAIKDESISLSKVGGRGVLNDKFKFVEDEKCVMNYTHRAWSGKGACSGRHWKIPMSKFDHFFSRLENLYYSFSMVLDIEHGFYEFNVVPLEGLPENAEVGISALISGNGKWEEA